MIVNCEKCNTKFELSDIEVTKINDMGRILKCGNCHHMWLVNSLGVTQSHTPIDHKLISSLKTTNEPSVMLDNVVANGMVNDYFKFTSISLFFKLSFFALLFLCFFQILIKYNQFFVRNNLSKSFIDNLGINNLDGLVLESVTIDKTSLRKENSPLILTGYIANNSDEVKMSPDIRIILYDDKGNILDKYIYNLPNIKILPGEKSKIVNRINNLPKNTHRILVSAGNYIEFLFS